MGFFDKLGDFLEGVNDFLDTVKYGNVDKKTKTMAAFLESKLGLTSEVAVDIAIDLFKLYSPTDREIRKVIEYHSGHRAVKRDIISEIESMLSVEQI